MPCVVSDEEKAPPRRQVGIRKANASESLMKCRKPICDIETGAYALSRDESGGCPFTGLTVSGMKATRSWSAAVAWNVGRQVPIPPPAGFGVVRGRAPSSSCDTRSHVASELAGRRADIVGGVVPGQYSVARARSDVRRWSRWGAKLRVQAQGSLFHPWGLQV